MKNIKDITISIFAIIGFAFLLSSFTTNGTEETTQQVYGTPESHVWDLKLPDDSGRAFLFNKQTGEVKLFVRSIGGQTVNGLRSYEAKELEYGDKG